MKYKAQKYNIGKVAKYYGITPDALRLYDKKGILSPTKNDDTNYRIYTHSDFVTMDYVIRMRNLGLSLDNIKAMLNDRTLSEMSVTVARQKSEIENKIDELHQTLILLKDYEKLLKESMENMDKPQIRMSPIFISQDIKKSMADTMKDFDGIKKESIPLLTARVAPDVILMDGFVEKAKDLNFRQKVVDYLVTMPDYGEISQSPSFPRDKFDIIEPCKCVYSIAYDQTNVQYESFNKIKNFLMENDLKPAGQLLCRIIANEKNTSTNAEYHELWFPVE